MGSSLVPLKSALLMTRRKKGSWNIGGAEGRVSWRASTDPGHQRATEMVGNGVW